jgi:hypothetical protein
MKKLMSIIVSILFALSLTGLCFAQAPAPTAAEPEKKVEEKKAPEKGAWRVLKALKVKGTGWAGEIVSVDAAAKTVVAKNKKGEMTFDVSEAKFAKHVKFENLKAGDKIALKYEEKDGKNMATGVAKQKHKHHKHKKAEKKAEEPATPATPAAPEKK